MAATTPFVAVDLPPPQPIDPSGPLAGYANVPIPAKAYTLEGDAARACSVGQGVRCIFVDHTADATTPAPWDACVRDGGGFQCAVTDEVAARWGGVQAAVPSAKAASAFLPYKNLER